MRAIQEFLYRIRIDSIFELLAYIDFFIFFKRFILHRAPVPSSAFKSVPKELLAECVTLLKKKEKAEYGVYRVPEEILSILRADLRNEENLKRLLCSICAHLGIDGGFIKLVVEDTFMSDRAGEIATDLAFTTIRLELKPHYTPEAVIAVLAHEADSSAFVLCRNSHERYMGK